MQHILRPSSEYAPSIVKQRDMNDIFDYYLNHLVSDEAQSTITLKYWRCEDGYLMVLQGVTSLSGTGGFR